jgi:cadmium resistance protein CadD (predicted permease)
VSFIGILTVVAYQIVLSEILPRISYMTLMNGFLNMSFFVVCASVVVSLWVGWLDRRGQTAIGDRIDRRSRWIFPVVYLGLLLFVVGMTLIVVE